MRFLETKGKLKWEFVVPMSLVLGFLAVFIWLAPVVWVGSPFETSIVASAQLAFKWVMTAMISGLILLLIAWAIWSLDTRIKPLSSIKLKGYGDGD